MTGSRTQRELPFAESLGTAAGAEKPAEPAEPARDTGGRPEAAETGSRVLRLPSARAAEERLLDEVAAAATARTRAFRAGDARALAVPLRVVVPSRSLREHVAGALVRRCGALLGVSVQTHRALALEVLERAGEAAPIGASLVPVLVRRLALAEPVLAETLAELEDGPALAGATVRDLVDAGLTPALQPVVDELLVELARDASLAAPAERARAVVRVAARGLAALEEHGLGHPTALLVRAREHVVRAGPAVLPTAALWIHGFADATALVADWLEALLRTFDARVSIVTPVDPADPTRREHAFSDPLAQRLADAAERHESVSQRAEDAPVITLHRAPGVVAEVRTVAARVRALLDAGVEPESIAIVLRRVEPWRAALDAQLGRLGIPFSAPGTGGGPDAAVRRSRALAALLAEVDAAPVGVWLDADATRDGDSPDLRLALHVLGVGRLHEWVAADVAAALGEREFLPLPVRRGPRVAMQADANEAGDPTEDGDEEASASSGRSGRRAIHRDWLLASQARAAALLERLADWPARAPFEVHTGALRVLLEAGLGWRDGDAVCEPAREALDSLVRDVPASLSLTRDEMAQLLASALHGAGEPPLGGAGAGVQVLSVTAARGRTFEHLFVLGLNRDVFPRIATEDPLLPDVLRLRLASVLPEIPVKRRARDEERHLFAELVTASPHVALVWQHLSDEGRERTASPLVVRLALLRPDLPRFEAPGLFDAPAPEASDPPGAAAPRPALEHAALAGLHAGPRAHRLALRVLALDEAMDALPPRARSDAGTLARFQLAVQDELDPRPAGPRDVPRLGPFHGYVGPSAAGDGVASALYVTHLEGVARCPWQHFLRRELGLEPVPDALDALPASDAPMRGRVLHRALEQIVRAALGPAAPRTLRDAFARGPVRVPWPDAATTGRLLQEAAREVALADGIRLPGFAEALARSVAPMLTIARALDWQDPEGPAVLGVELEGEATLLDAAGSARRIRFRADRADLASDDTLRLTDYKTGRTIHESANADTRQRNFVARVREGRAFQAPVYWLGARVLAERAEGRLVHLREDIAEAGRVFSIAADGEPVVAAFEGAARVVLEAWDRATLFPRLVEPDGAEGSACGRCEVSTACLRGDSAQRARLRAFAGSGDARGAADRALVALFHIASGAAS